MQLPINYWLTNVEGQQILGFQGCPHDNIRNIFVVPPHTTVSSACVDKKLSGEFDIDAIITNFTPRNVTENNSSQYI